MSARRVAATLWLLSFLALLPSVQAGEPTTTDAAPQQESTLHITEAELLSVAGTGYSAPPPSIEDAALPTEGWQKVGLPYTAGRELVPTPSGGVSTLTDWYRLDVDALAPSTQPRFLYLPRWKTLGHIAVYGDGVLLYQSHGSPVHNGYNQPLLLPLNATANTLSPTSVLIRVNRLRSSGSGFSSVWVGEQGALAWRYQVRQMLQVQLPFMGSAAFLAVGAFAFAVWLGKRRESLYLLFAAISALAFVRMLHYYVSGDYLPVSDEWFEWLTVSALLWLIVLIHLFLERLHQQPSPWLTRSSVGLATLCSVATLPHVSASIASLYLITPLLNLAVLPVAVLIFAVNLRKALRAQLPAGRLVAGWTVFAVTFTSYDGLLQNNLVSPESVYTSPYAIIGLFFVFSYIMFQRYTGAFAEVGRLNQGLAERLRAREAELEQSYQRLRVIENQQMLNAERRRLMQDMHDGLGSSLIGAIRSVERGIMNDAAISNVLKGCMEDLKLAIDSMESVDADLLLLLATLRFRLAPRIESAGIALQWEVQPVPALPWLDPGSALHILRIMQECVANVLRHTRATTIRFSTATGGQGVCVMIEDNGAGFVLQEALQRGGRGLRNQQRRALAIGGHVSWESGNAGTRLVLWLPLERTVGVERPVVLS
ncbi:7TM diverse intracellular signaling domain-containing protein [Variovorax sp. J22G73]|uniref:sensor histidine kinase n=1 Tax=unclassified Variovorax TaxID=663243 RepID=UPI0025785C0B|nr:MULTISPECIES: ATP-binding protein [unclassified Variovorax]MDM0004912.1 7TM diverse intracellular signaling domain-containing protein [Variovorax sp. J22R203]MDM0098328.1 7TM diverse intracellular signaling domain-containing protein [Variovorax sp. J22G73]